MFVQRKIVCINHDRARFWPDEFHVINNFSQNLTFYPKGKKDTTQNEKDIVGTEGTNQGHSGQKDTIGTFEVFFSFQEVLSRWNHARGYRAPLEIFIHKTRLLCNCSRLYTS